VLPFPIPVVTFQGVDLELFKHSGLFQIEELVLDSFRETSIEFPIQCNVIPPSVGGMLREFNHILIDMMVFLHFKRSESTFRGLGKIRFTKELVELSYKFSPVASDGRLGISHKVRLPPQQGNFRKEGHCIGEVLAVAPKLVRFVVKNHHASRDEGLKLAGVFTHEFVGFG